MSVKILVVDDSEFDRRFIESVLSRRLNVELDFASSGAEALKILDESAVNIYNLILLDIDMPGMDGEIVLSRIRQSKVLEKIPILMVSAHSRDEVIARCLRAGANDFVEKPLRVEVAIGRIESQLRIAESARISERFEAISAVQAMVVTYNHEINNPLTIAVMSVEQLKKRLGARVELDRLEVSLARIAEVVKQIREVVSADTVQYDDYVGDTKAIRIRKTG